MLTLFIETFGKERIQGDLPVTVRDFAYLLNYSNLIATVLDLDSAWLPEGRYVKEFEHATIAKTSFA